ncbi:MAG: NifU family protein [Magnetococcus sp. YQC-9]
MLEQVQKVLEEIRPMLQRDGGDVELVGITADNIVNVRLRGACGTCPGAIMTLKGGIERIMKQRVPEVVAVESVR